MPRFDLRNFQASWNGRELEMRGSGGCHLEVRLDGSRLVDLHADADGQALLELAYSPSGRALLTFQIKVLDGSIEPETHAFSIEIGKPGILPGSSQPTMAAEPAPIGCNLPAAAQPMQAEVAIIIPVYNAAEAVKRCLDSVLANSSGHCRLIVIDDASTEPAIAPLLAGYHGIAGVEILSNPVNLGFTATVNRGMSLAGRADVVLLNADTEVASQWLTGLRHAVSSSSNIATATAVSDNAGAFSVPELERENPMPPGWTFAQTARAHWQTAGHVYPILPTGNGFCMYIRRSVLDQVGLFDVEAFPQGYGEENDFCQRACAGGYRHVIAGNVLVRHARSLSFGSERRAALGQAGMQVLRERWPDYEADVGRQLFSFERRVLDWRVRRIHALAAEHVPRPRLLRFCPQADPVPMSGYDIRSLDVIEGRLCLCGEVIAEWDPTGSSAANQEIVARLLRQYAFELVEFEQGMDADLIDMLKSQADRLGIPVLSLASGEFATVLQRETVLHSLNGFERPNR